MGKQEILPPVRQLQVVKAEPVTITASVPRVYRAGIVDSAIDKYYAERQTKATYALAERTAAETALVARQTELVETDAKRQEALFKRQLTVERLGHELTVTRIRHSDERREAWHSYERNELRRQKETAEGETALTKAKTAYTDADTDYIDARQRRHAQIEHGDFSYEIIHHKKQAEMMDVKLGIEERRRILAKKWGGDEETPEDAANRVLAERDERNADGYDQAEADQEVQQIMRRSK
jgi:hypothetical protein